MIDVRCPCGTLLRAGQEHAGKFTRCPKCGQTVAIPRAEAIQPTLLAAPPAAVTREEPPDRADFEERQADRRPRRYDDEGYGARRRPGVATSGKAAAGMIL